ncbi:MAG: right-handed parallel beta-helix repeat-containing protein, partial [Calditrichaeota bacterium]|nr:right-handed parallel beta-helix repeat-containing protein [Calditrichota bacterium]
MKNIYSKILLLLLLLWPGIGFARTYFVDASHGKDSNSGLSPASPWKTVDKVSRFSLAPGDSVLFKRGEI